MRPGLVILLLLLSACGQRGPLYLPEQQEPETVMSTGDASGETDEQSDWQETGTAQDGAAEEGVTDDGTDLTVSPTEEGPQSSPPEVEDKEKNAKDKEAASGVGSGD